ncbi:hypothetical protein OIU76_007493 [Salix suchowensis]|nr:hypothetical protein OIU76_007493 [Salix suchowensis]
MDLLNIKLEGIYHVFIVSGPLLPCTCFHRQLFHSFLKFHVLLINALHLCFFLTEFLKNFLFDKGDTLKLVSLELLQDSLS